MKKKLGLVLSGGGSLGAYQVGAIKALDELGYDFDIITGTSIGSINGVFVATNNIKMMEELWLNISIKDIIKDGIDLKKETIFYPQLSNIPKLIKSYMHIKGTDISPFKEYCKKYIPVNDIINTKKLIGITTVKFPTFKEVKILLNNEKTNYILPYLHASSACYPIFPLEKIDSTFYIDGGYRDNLPLNYCFELGADEVIAINLPLPNLDINNKYMLNMSNVKLIELKHVIPEMMNFNHEFIVKLIKLGYLDVYKKYGKYYGYKYYFIKDKKNEEIETKVFRKIIKEVKLLKELMTDSINNNDPILYIILEKIAKFLDLDYLIEYDINTIFKLILEKKEKLKGFNLDLFNIINYVLSN